MECKYCGEEMSYKEWHEDGHLVEWRYKCGCGYMTGCAYGQGYEQVSLECLNEGAVKNV